MISGLANFGWGNGSVNPSPARQHRPLANDQPCRAQGLVPEPGPHPNTGVCRTADRPGRRTVHDSTLPE
eukprot:6640721-Alexandrium_andersonii.AAC.1